MAVRVESLSKRYAGSPAPALDAVTLEVPAGRCAAILGASGAGKSTLLRCLVGLEPFDSGAIEIDGVIIAAGGQRSKAERQAALATLRGRTGLVFQSFELFPHLSVLDNCTLAPRKVRGRSRAEAEERAHELLAGLGLAEKAQAFPEALSGGQRQRAAIARALAMEPRVLLYDEPTSALDTSLRAEVRLTLQRVAATGITQLVVTHDVAFARDAAELAFVLHAGRVVESGSPSELFTRPSHEATQRLVA
jgi:ABC-type polar amino acid transport system ATPase subunit